MKYPQMWEELKDRIEMFNLMDYQPEYQLILDTMDRLEDEYE